MVRRTWTLTNAAAAIALVGALAGCGTSGDAKTDGAAAQALVLGASDVAVAQSTDLVAGVQVSGTLTPRHDVRIGAPVGDVVEQMLVQEGQRVTKGQVLARFRMSAVEPAAVGAESRFKAARADWERMRNLLREGAVAERDVEAAEATMREAEAAHAYARKTLDEATVRAPITGTVAERYVQAGDRPGMGDPVLRVVDVSELEFEATITTDDVTRVHPGDLVLLDITGLPRGGVEGRLARVNAAADPATRQIKVYVVVPNRGGKLVGGLFASGRLVTERRTGVLAVPSTGVRTEDGKPTVWVVQDGKLRPQVVELGMRDVARDLVEIRSGLAAGAQVVVGPLQSLTAGQAVQIAKQEG